MLHLFAVEKALEDLKPPTDANKVAEHLLPWLNDLRLSQNAIDTILSLPPRNTMLENARYKLALGHSKLHLYRKASERDRIAESVVYVCIFCDVCHI